MCYKTSKFSREVGKNKQNEDSGKSRHKSNNKSRRENYSSEDSDSNKRLSIPVIKCQLNANLFNFRKSKQRSKKDYSDDSEDDKRRGKSGKKEDKKSSSKSRSYKQKGSSEDSDDDDAVAAYYAVRIDKHKGSMVVSQHNGSDNGRYDSSSESTSTAPNQLKRPNIDAPAPAKGILKKVASNPSLAKLDGMSEISGAVSEVGYITNKLNQRLKEEWPTGLFWVSGINQ